MKGRKVPRRALLRGRRDLLHLADASQLKEICQGGGFRLTDETEYYYNYARSSKEILNAVTANDKITVIDHDGDNAFDVVLVTTSRPATVTATSP